MSWPNQGRLVEDSGEAAISRILAASISGSRGKWSHPECLKLEFVPHLNRQDYEFWGKGFFAVEHIVWKNAFKRFT